METAAIEEIVNHAIGQGGDPEKKKQATQLIDQLRLSPDRWSVGLKLFFEGQSELCRFFGLSLVRDFLSSAFDLSKDNMVSLGPVYRSIREAVWAWTANSVSSNFPIPVFILNNLVTVLTLLVKLEFPESWSTAFSDLLTIGSSNTAGLDLTVRVICDLEVEVVMFKEGRGRDEVTHNVIIKDAMRASDNSITKNLVEFLCRSASSVRATNVDLSQRCLRCLADMIGWIEISLVACESTLSCVYQALRDRELCGAALACLLELVKKGMEPVAKVQMLHAIGLAQVLALVPIGVEPVTQAEEDDDDAGAEDELALVVDVYLLELIGCWSKYEDILLGASPVAKGAAQGEVPSPSEVQQLQELAPTISSLLHSILPIALNLLKHTYSDSFRECSVAVGVVPSLSRLIILFKQQFQHRQKIETIKVRDGENSSFFIATDYLTPLLVGIYQQMQYKEDFGYDPSDDDDAEVIEAKKEIRKLFVNCCRVHPEPCLQLISMALSALPQLLSRASFAPLEAALRLIYSFSECGPQFTAVVNEGTFPALISAIHQTDIASHPHRQVVLAYYEICFRYIRHAGLPSVKRFVTAMVDQRGLRHPNKQVRCRTAYFLLKTVEALEGKASTLLSVVGSFADVILSSPDLSLTSKDASSFNTNAMLTDSAELHLLEAIGLITSSTYCYFEGDTGVMDPNSALYQQKQLEVQNQKRLRQQILDDVLRLLCGHVQSILSHPELARHSEQLGACAAHKVSSLSSLAKGHNYKIIAKNPDTAVDAALVFEGAAAAVIAIAHSLCHVAVVRGKCLIFHHRMIMCMGIRSLEAISHSLPVLLAQCNINSNRIVNDSQNSSESSCNSSSEGGSEEILQLLNQGMLEFQQGALILVNSCLGPAFEKCWALCAVLENDAVALVGQSGGDNSLGASGQMKGKEQIEAPHFESERVALQKQSLVFLQHIATQHCDQALYSELNSKYLSAIFDNEILVGLQGGRGRISRGAGIPLRKAAVSTLTGLVKAWLWTHALSPLTSTNIDPSKGISAPPSVPVPPHLSTALWAFIKEKAIVVCLRACTDGTSLDLKDAAAQALLVDIGALLWTLASPSCQQEPLRAYFQEALPALGWPLNASTALQNMLIIPGPLGTFKENFKKFIRSAVIS